MGRPAFTQPSSSGCACVCGATPYISVPAAEPGKHSMVFLLFCLGRPTFAGFYCSCCASDSKRDGVAVLMQFSVGFVAQERLLCPCFLLERRILLVGLDFESPLWPNVSPPIVVLRRALVCAAHREGRKVPNCEPILPSPFGLRSD